MRISIITATYNSASTVADTFESVLKQTYKDIDYWVIDGGSSDRTLDIIKEYQPKFNGKMHYISEKDRGIYDAMNKGLAHCTGDVVGILNSDDYFTDDNVLADLNNTFENNDVDSVYGDIHFINDSNPDKIVRYYSVHFGFALVLCLHIRHFMPSVRYLRSMASIRWTTKLLPITT